MNRKGKEYIGQKKGTKVVQRIKIDKRKCGIVLKKEEGEQTTKPVSY